MPMQDFVDVRMSLDGQRAYEHQCPGEPEQDGALTRYIEVASGQCWSIDVRVLKNFSFRSAPHLCVEMKTDDQRSLWYHHRPRRDFPRQRGYLKDDFAIGRFGRVRAWDDQRGVWAYHKYQIGALGTTEGQTLPAAKTREDVDQLGRICVTFYRAKRVRKAQPYIFDGKLSQVLDDIPESATKGLDIKVNTKFAAKEAATAPPVLYDYVPIDGTYGKVYTFVFKYRSRSALQNLGIIERSSPPLPDPILRAERAEAMADEAWRELKRLRALYRAGFAGSRTIKQGASTAPATPSTNVASYKRKRDEDGNDESEVEEVALPPKKRRLVVDLTDDD